MRRLIILFIAAAALLSGCELFIPPPTPDPAVARGKAVFDSYCSRCHSTNPDTIVVGPSLFGISERAGSRVAGLDAQAYILDSIRNPTNYTVEGFPEGVMPESLDEEIPPDDIEAVVKYLFTLK